MAESSKKVPKKGLIAEEAVRQYFLSAGYFVVRGIPVRYNSTDITDIDLWLYSRSSLITRERIVVDIKHKKTPQALERVFWTKGLQSALNLDKSIVVTSDKRPGTVEFGRNSDVLVFDGNFLSAITDHYASVNDRLSEEEFKEYLDDLENIHNAKTYYEWLKAQKAKLIQPLSFNTCNSYLEEIGKLLPEISPDAKMIEFKIRLLYIFISYFLISLDYASYPSSHQLPGEKFKVLDAGFRYGDSGKSRIKDITNAVASIVPAFSPDRSLITRQAIEKEIIQTFSDHPAEHLAEFFSRLVGTRTVFLTAKMFEKHAYDPFFTNISKLDVELRAVFGVLIDYHGLDRKRYL